MPSGWAALGMQRAGRGTGCRRGESMRRALLGFLGLLIAGLVFAVIAPHAASQRVYLVGEVAAGFQHQPQGWIGRTVLVRGRMRLVFWQTRAHVVRSMVVGSLTAANGGTAGAEACTSDPAGCPSPLDRPFPAWLAPAPNAPLHLLLQAPEGLFVSTHPVPALNLLVRSADPISTFLRRMPVLRRFIPVSQRVRWGNVAVYSVSMSPRPQASCRSVMCASDGTIDVQLP